MAGSKQEPQKQFDTILSELHKDIDKEKLQSCTPRTSFFPVSVSGAVFKRSREKLTLLYEISTGDAQHEDSQRFADKIAGSPEPDHQAIQPAARVFAILLSIHQDPNISFDLNSSIWQTFIRKCVDSQHPDSFHDDRLPFDLHTAHQHLDINYGGAFFSRQYKYCAPVVVEGESQRLENLHAPLLYLSEAKLGSGHSGTVYAVKVERSHFRYVTGVRKVISSPDANFTLARKDIKLRQGIERIEDTPEWKIFQRTMNNKLKSHRHVAHVLTCFIFEDKLSLFLYKADMDLASFMQKQQKPDYGQAQSFIKAMGEVAGAFKYLHTDVHCYHLDIKPENILVFDSKYEIPMFQLADFSISKFEQSHRDFQLSTLCESGGLGIAATCIPPEQLAGKGVGKESDVWGFGGMLCIYLFVAMWWV